MNRKGLYFLIALALGGVGAVHAQDAAAPAGDSAASTAPVSGSYSCSASSCAASTGSRLRVRPRRIGAIGANIRPSPAPSPPIRVTPPASNAVRPG